MKNNTLDMQKELKKVVFGQDDLLKSLAVIAWTHKQNEDRKAKGLDPINNKSLIIGPSGCGKTYAVKKLAEKLGKKFIEIDCSTLQGNNYTGANHSYDMFDDAIATYGMNEVENGIIFLDEFDKSLDVYAYKRYGSRFVQRDLLKIFEGEPIKSKNYGEIKTAYMTIIAAGSFFEASDSSSYFNEPKVSKMGFGVDKIVNTEDGHTKFNFNVDDLIKMGHLPELIGRFSRIVNMNMLDEKDIFNILKNGESQIKIYKEQLANMAINLLFTDKYYEYLSKNVSISKTGFRDVNKLISDDIDDIIIHLSKNIIRNIVVDYDKEKVIIDFKDGSGHILDRISKPVKKIEAKPVNAFRPIVELD